MYEPSKLGGDPNNLTGSLLITALEAGTGIQHLGLFSYDTEKLISLHSIFPQNLKDILRGDLEQVVDSIKPTVELLGLGGVESVCSLSGAVNIPIPFDALEFKDANRYDAGVVKDEAEFLDKIVEVISGYFSTYFSQQKAKTEQETEQETEVNRLTVYDIAIGDIHREIWKLYRGITSAVSDGDPIAQLQAEDKLREFAPNKVLSYSVEEIIRLAHLEREGKSDVVTAHCRMIKALVNEEYELAVSMQRHVERLQQEFQIPA